MIHERTQNLQTLPEEEAGIKSALDALGYAARCAGPTPQCCIRRDPDRCCPNFAVAIHSALPQVRQRLDEVLMGDNPEHGLDALLEIGALNSILPEVQALVGFGDGEWLHKDVWKHTKQVVHQTERRLELRWAALLHDIGKPKTRSISPEGEVHFLGHAELGARMFDRIDRRLRLFSHQPQIKQSIRFLILHHLRANQYEPNWTDSAVRRFAREIGGELDNLLCLSRADITTKRPEKKRHGLQQLDELSARIGELAKLDAIVPPLPSGIGNVIMETFGLPESKLIGDIKRALESAVDNGEIQGYQTCAFYIEFLNQNRERFQIPQ